MEIINDLDIDVEALIAFKFNKNWESFRPIDKPNKNGLPGTAIGGQQAGTSGRKNIVLKPTDINAEEFKVYIYTKEVPKKDVLEGIKVHPGNYRKVIDFDNKCREVHHIEVNKLTDNRLDGYKYRVVIHYYLYEDRPKCPESLGALETHKDPTIIHPDDPEN